MNDPYILDKREYPLCKKCVLIVRPPYYCLCWWRDWILHHGTNICECNDYYNEWVMPDEEPTIRSTNPNTIYLLEDLEETAG